MRALLFCLFALLPLPAGAQDVEEEFRSDYIRSDLSRWDFDEPGFWPQGFIQCDELFVDCASRIWLGDWLFVPNSAAESLNASWMRITDSGEDHCAAVFRDQYEREFLARAPTDLGYFVRIGEATSDGEPIELWAIQRGGLHGSAFTLLARSPDRAPDHGIIESFMVLQQRCPRNSMRISEENLDTLRTSSDYCTINSKEEMLALAVEMLDYPPLGTMTRVGDSDWVAPPQPEVQQNEPEPEPEPEAGSFLLEALTSTPQ